MSMPNVPNITPNICIKREQVVNVLLLSIALEELGLAHIINAEGEKIQAVLSGKACSMDDLLEIDKSVDKMLKDIVKKEILLQFKFDNVLEVMDCPEKERCEKRHSCDD